MAKKLSASKAREILHDKSVHGKPLTDKQRRYFGYVASGGTPKAQSSIELPYNKRYKGLMQGLRTYYEGRPAGPFTEDPEAQAAHSQQIAEGVKQGTDWLQNWYSRRAELPQFKSVGSKRADLFSQQQPIVPVAEEYLGQGVAAGTLPNSPQTPIVVAGYSKNPARSSAYAMQHELTHRGSFRAPQIFRGKAAREYFKNIEPASSKETSIPSSQYDWIKSPIEAEAVLNWWRRQNNIDPLKTLTPEEVTESMQYYQNLPQLSEEEYEKLKGDKDKFQKMHGDYHIKYLWERFGKDPKRFAQYHNETVMAPTMRGSDKAQASKTVPPSMMALTREPLAVESTATPMYQARTAGFPEENQAIALAQLKATESKRKTEEQQKAKRIAERAAAVQTIDKDKPFTLPSGETKKYKDMDWREKGYVAGKALEERGRLFPGEESFIDTWVNPAQMLGSMAANLGEAPYEARQSNSAMPYVSAVAVPLLTGRALSTSSINPLGRQFWEQTLPAKRTLSNVVFGLPEVVENVGKRIGSKKELEQLITTVKEGLKKENPGVVTKEEQELLDNIRVLGKVAKETTEYNLPFYRNIEKAAKDVPDNYFEELMGFNKQGLQERIAELEAKESAERAAAAAEKISTELSPPPATVTFDPETGDWNTSGIIDLSRINLSRIPRATRQAQDINTDFRLDELPESYINIEGDIARRYDEELASLERDLEREEGELFEQEYQEWLASQGVTPAEAEAQGIGMPAYLSDKVSKIRDQAREGARWAVGYENRDPLGMPLGTLPPFKREYRQQPSILGRLTQAEERNRWSSKTGTLAEKLNEMLPGLFGKASPKELKYDDELVHSLFAGPRESPLRVIGEAYKKVKDAEKGKTFIPSESLSSDSYNRVTLPLTEKAVKEGLVDVNFHGFEELNMAGFPTKANVPAELLVREINTRIQEINKYLKNKLPFAKLGEQNWSKQNFSVLYPRITVTRKQAGGALAMAAAGTELGISPIEEDPIPSTTAPKPKFTEQERGALAQRVVEIAKKRMDKGEYVDIPEDIQKAAERNKETAYGCIGGVCTVLKEAGVIPNVYWSNTEFAKQAKNMGFQNMGYGVKGVENLEPGDVLQHLNDMNEEGNYYPGHAQIFVGKNPEGQYEFFDNFWKSKRTYTEDELRDWLSPSKKRNERQASIYKVNEYRAPKSTMSPEAEESYRIRKQMIEHETSTGPMYNYAIRPDSKYAKDMPTGMEKFIQFTQNEENINNLVRALGVPKSVVHDELLNTFGELGQENKWEDRRLGGKFGVENLVERIAKPKSWSIGPGQIKFNEIPDDIKKAFGINKPKDLYNWDKVLPVMTAINIRNRQYMERQGENLSSKLIGTPGVGAQEIEGGVGRWTPYMYRGGLSDPRAKLEKEAREYYSSFRMNKQKEDAMVEEYINQRLPSLAKRFDPGSYAQKVFQNIDENLARTDVGTGELPPVEVVGKRAQRKGGGSVIADRGTDIVMPQDGTVQRAMSPGYQGLGYSNKGYEYNSAWGGRWEMGGSLPGASGMMYARTGQDWKPKSISEAGSSIPKYMSPDTILEEQRKKVKMQMGGGLPVSSRGLYDYPNQDVIVPTSDGRITMKGIDYPVKGTDQYGNTMTMQPGREYQFPGNIVREKPITGSTRSQTKGQLKKLDQLLNFTNYNNG